MQHESSFAQIIDINAAVNCLGHPVRVLLYPGTYHLEVIGAKQGGRYDAWSVWGEPRNAADSPGHAEAMQPEPRRELVGWTSSYAVLSPYVVPHPPLVGHHFPGQGYVVEDHLFHQRAADALASAHATVFSLFCRGTVGFATQQTPAGARNVKGGLSLRLNRIHADPVLPVRQSTWFRALRMLF